jgi:hypothetical protein
VRLATLNARSPSDRLSFRCARAAARGLSPTPLSGRSSGPQRKPYAAAANLASTYAESGAAAEVVTVVSGCGVEPAAEGAFHGLGGADAAGFGDLLDRSVGRSPGAGRVRAASPTRFAGRCGPTCCRGSTAGCAVVCSVESWPPGACTLPGSRFLDRRPVRRRGHGLHRRSGPDGRAGGGPSPPRARGHQPGRRSALGRLRSSSSTSTALPLMRWCPTRHWLVSGSCPTEGAVSCSTVTRRTRANAVDFVRLGANERTHTGGTGAPSATTPASGRPCWHLPTGGSSR